MKVQIEVDISLEEFDAQLHNVRVAVSQGVPLRATLEFLEALRATIVEGVGYAR